MLLPRRSQPLVKYFHCKLHVLLVVLLFHSYFHYECHLVCLHSQTPACRSASLTSHLKLYSTALKRISDSYAVDGLKSSIFTLSRSCRLIHARGQWHKDVSFSKIQIKSINSPVDSNLHHFVWYVLVLTGREKIENNLNSYFIQKNNTHHTQLQQSRRETHH